MANTTENPLTAYDLKVEYLENPSAIDVEHPRFSWKVRGEGRNRVQSAYQIVVATTREKLAAGDWDVWDTGKAVTNQTNQIEYNGALLESKAEYHWKVRVWDEGDIRSEWSVPAKWSMGVLHFSDWEGLFIGLDVGQFEGNKYDSLYLPPARYLRKSFSVDKKVKRATAYTTALGVYEFRLNGAKVGDYYLLPGWTDYNKRVYYQSFDVTDMITTGENVVGAVVADGWYSGYIGYALLVRLDKVRGFYGENPSFMGQIVIEYEDGSEEVIASNKSWKASQGGIREADILMGETYDATQQNEGWDAPGFEDSLWMSPKVYTYPNGRLQAYPGELIEERERLTPLSVKEPKPGTYVFDLGKNIAGIAELKVRGQKGTKVKIKYGEILNSDGTVLTENLRMARATDTYILSGQGEELWQPKFTYHGFQYVQVTGYPGEPDADAITGIALSSIATDASTFKSSNGMNNQLYSNILTTQSANFFEVPTDCPQRDERLGWTGDAQTYCRSASYNADVSAFFTKFLVDLDDAQRWYGAYPNFAPFPYSRPDQYAPAWMDAGVIIPWNMYKVYGDTRIVERMYPGMKKFMDFQADASTDYLRPGGGNNWGDWLAVDEQTSHDFIGSSYYGYDAKLMAEMAEAIGENEDAVSYMNLFNNIKKAFAKKYILENGYTTEDTQTSYALALYFGLYPHDLAQKGADRLAEKVINNGNKFSTGFLGTKHVMLALAQYGYADLCFKLFQQTEYPSWGYSVVNGSTSIWERWNSYTKNPDENSSLNAAMNSFSHYAFGSVAEWMFIHGLGIDTNDEGFRNIIIKPAISKEMGSMVGSYESINGLIESGWEMKGNRLTLNVTVPANTRAEVYIPTSKIASIKEGKTKLNKHEGLKILEVIEDEAVVEIGSGKYSFSCTWKQ
ncbi:alpha-L-rhamnosidase [Marinoscillum furvescens]|uniref:alpha-L-rhamnosidase n=1 Tax=Marinoscillum furvescens TaxID=1026 RepID=UPI0014764C75|nr:alpha-L-rhamnosidase [Marinoscillum furvescens]